MRNCRPGYRDETPSGSVLGLHLGGPGGPQILHAGFEAFDLEPHRTATREAKLDLARRIVVGGRLEGDGEELENALAGVGVDAGDLHIADAVEMERGAPALAPLS